MRFLDIAAASGYAAVCLTVIVLMNPFTPRQAAYDARAQSSMDTAISAYIESVGLPFLETSQQGAICASAAAASNSTLAVAVLVDGDGCRPPPASPLASSSITLELPGRTLVIQAWLERQ